MPRALALSVVLLLIAVSTAARAASVDRPSWTAGDFWTYRTNTTLTPGLDLTGTATSTVTGTVPATDGGTGSAFRVVVAGSGAATGTVTTPNGTFSISGGWTLTGEERFEPRSLHPVYDLIDLSVNGTYGYLVRIPFSLRFQNTTTFGILSDGWGFPWVVGTAGNLTVSYAFNQDLYSPAGHLNQNGTGRSTFGFSLGAAVTMGTPAGTFEAYPLRTDAPDGTWERSFFAPAAGNHVRTESHDRDGNLTSVGTLVAYRYQAAEPATFLGLTSIQWAVALPVAGVAAATIVFLARRHRGKKAAAFPPAESASGPTSGPRGP